MLDPSTQTRPVPRWLHAWAVFTVAATALLLALGGMVTTFRVGMADPVWPTAPWYLFFISWREPSAGFLIEHTHRLAGFVVGAAAAVLALGIWWTGPRRGLRWIGLVALVALLALFGQFHREMMAQVHAAIIRWPGSTYGLLAALAAVAGVVAVSLRRGEAGSGLRALAVVALLAVMVQGLLGGFRVRLNAWAGTDLAAVHGVFAQVVFSLLVSLAVLTARRRAGDVLPPEQRSRFRSLALLLAALAFVQLVWGALIRHAPSPLTQRLHLLTAFAVVAAAAWFARAAYASPAAWRRFGTAVVVLGGLLVAQVALGVEAWMGKFGTGIPPELQTVTPQLAMIRTLHVLVGTGVLAASVVLAVLAFLRLRNSECGLRVEKANGQPVAALRNGSSNPQPEVPNPQST